MGGFGTLEVPQLPAKPVPCVPAHFKSVSEYSNGSLQTMKSVAWGPYLPTNQLREEIHGQMDHVEGNAELPCTPHILRQREWSFYFCHRSLWRVPFHHGFICSLNPEVYRSLIHEVDHYFMRYFPIRMAIGGYTNMSGETHLPHCCSHTMILNDTFAIESCLIQVDQLLQHEAMAVTMSTW